MIKRVLLGITALVLAVSTAACGGDVVDREGQVQMPASSSSYEGEHFEVAVAELEAAGFTNVTTRPLGDLITGWLKSDGEIEGIRVDGESSFSRGSWFASDTSILITYHSFPERDQEDPADGETDPAPEPETEIEDAAEPEPAPASEESGVSDATRSEILEERLKEVFGGVASMSELLLEMPDSWPGYVVDVRVEGDLAYFTLQVDGNTPDGERLGEEAARALSTLLSKEDVAGVSWLIVEDGAGVVIDQKMPAPTN